MTSLRPASRLALVLLALPAWLGAAVASGQELFGGSPDVTIELGVGLVTADEDAAIDNQLGIVLAENLGTIPANVDVIALGLEPSGDRLFAVDTTVDLGGLVVRPGDVVRFDGSTHTLAFDADAAGLPVGVATDAAAINGSGLLLSFDTTVDLGGGVIAADEDLVDWDGALFSMAFDGSAEGVPVALDVDAAQDQGGGSFLLSFDTSGSIGGVDFDDEDVVRYDGSTWSLEIDASGLDADWQQADLDAVFVPEIGIGFGAAIGGLIVAVARRPRR